MVNGIVRVFFFAPLLGPSSFPALWAVPLTWAFFPWTWHRCSSTAGPGFASPAGWSHTLRLWHRRHSHAAGPHTGWARTPRLCCVSRCLSEAPVGNETCFIQILGCRWEKLQLDSLKCGEANPWQVSPFLGCTRFLQCRLWKMASSKMGESEARDILAMWAMPRYKQNKWNRLHEG